MQVFILALIVGFAYGCTNETQDTSDEFFFFPNLDAIKEYFRNDDHPLSSKILERFEKDCLYMPDPGIPRGRRKPFIVIEGNDRGSRNIVGMKLARRLNGRYLNNLAPCLHDYFKHLPQGSVSRRVFYLLSVYATVFNAKVHLNLNRAVVLNGYWWEQVTFSLLQALKGAPFPPSTSPYFRYPEDLMRPDLIVYIDQPEKPSLQKQRSAEMYQALGALYPVMIQTMSKVFRVAIDEIYLTIRANLSDRLDFRYKADPYYEYL